jgi:hypothetical protein
MGFGDGGKIWSAVLGIRGEGRWRGRDLERKFVEGRS